MPITQTNIFTDQGTTDATSKVLTNPFTPTNALVLTWISSTVLAGGPPPIPTLSGLGMTWVQIGTVLQNFGAVVNGQRLSLFRGLSASPTTDAITADFGGVTQSQFLWSVVQVDNVDTSGTNGSGAVVQVVTGNGAANTSLALSLAALGDAVNNATFGAFCHDTAEASFVGAGYTLIAGAASSESMDIASEWLLPGSTTVDMSWTTSSHAVGIAVEVKSSTTPPPSVPGGQVIARVQGGSRVSVRPQSIVM